MWNTSKYILFGAGITGMAVMGYYGKDKIVAVIDNNPQKIGTLFNGILVISFETYLAKYSDFTIIVSIYSKHYFDCIEQMRKNHITNYFTSPPVIYGFETPEQFAEKNKLIQCKKIVFYGCNPITERIENCIYKNSKLGICYIDNHLAQMKGNKKVINIEELNEDDTVILTTNEIEDSIRSVLNKRSFKRIIDIYQYQERRKSRYEYLEKYRNIYAGKRCFIIGNGPSLRKEDLTTLEQNNEISFAANGIYHIYNETPWRPTHYMLCDALAYTTMYDDIKNFENENMFIAEFCYTNLKKIIKAKRFYLINKLYHDKEFGFSDDIVKGLYSGRTITYVMIQMACYMGIKEIYLLGVDWTGGKGTERIDFYQKDSVDVDKSCFDMFIEEKYAYESALMYARKQDIQIYNATRGGKLEVFERVEFDNLFAR